MEDEKLHRSRVPWVSAEDGAGNMPPVKGALFDRRILIVEDEFFLADDVDQTLTKAGAIVMGPVPSIDAARELLAGKNAMPDAAVLDVNLSGDMVYSLAQTLIDRDIPFVFTTGYDHAAIPSKFSGFVVLQKPIDPREIVGALSEVLATA